MDRRTDGRMDGRMDGQTELFKTLEVSGYTFLWSVVVQVQVLSSSTMRKIEVMRGKYEVGVECRSVKCNFKL